ncbi:MAG: redoxin domain-containing protein [Pirellulaceae bacterium]|nr:redoxin domain-containing protein [Pirellulaceae bacterium]
MNIGQTSQRAQTLYAGDGFLTQSSKWIHVAVPNKQTVTSLAVRWPGTKNPEAFEGLQPGKRYVLRQGTGRLSAHAAEGVASARDVTLTPSTLLPSPLRQHTPLRMSAPPVIEEIRYESWEGDEVILSAAWDKPLLLIFWASWCQPCLTELHELQSRLADLGDAAPKLLALNVERLDDTHSNLDELRAALRKTGFLGDSGLATEQLVSRLNKLHQQAVYRPSGLPLPFSVFLDQHRRLRVVYTGKIQMGELATDVRLRTKDNARNLAVPFAGRWGDKVFVTHPIAVTNVQIEQGYLDEARDYLAKYVDKHPPPPDDRMDDEAVRQRYRLAGVHHQWGVIERRMGNARASLRQMQRALKFHSTHLGALTETTLLLRSAGKLEEAHRFLLRAVQVQPNDADYHNKLGVIRKDQDRLAEAIPHFRDALQIDSNWHPAAHNLAWILATSSDPGLRDGETAVRLAEKLCQAFNYQQPQALDTYAAALAETGHYARAPKLMEDALAIVRESPPTNALQRLIKKLKARKTLYENQQPYRE